METHAEPHLHSTPPILFPPLPSFPLPSLPQRVLAPSLLSSVPAGSVTSRVCSFVYPLNQQCLSSALCKAPVLSVGDTDSSPPPPPRNSWPGGVVAVHCDPDSDRNAHETGTQTKLEGQRGVSGNFLVPGKAMTKAKTCVTMLGRK